MTSRTEAAALLRLAVGRTARRLRQNSGTELTPSQTTVLAAIARNGELTPSAIADHERISRPTATRIVAQLRKRGLVATRGDELDGRSYLVSVSTEGAALRELRRARKNTYLTRLLRDATDDEVQVLAAAAEIMLDLLAADE
jgi:DNA-binding MarR family transcriptional regulator